MESQRIGRGGTREPLAGCITVLVGTGRGRTMGLRTESQCILDLESIGKGQNNGASPSIREHVSVGRGGAGSEH